MLKRHSFTLVEILLALGIVMIGVISLMGLFPAAAKVSSDAAMETYGANAIEDVSNFIREMSTRTDGSTDSGWQKWIIDDEIIPKNQPDSMLGKKAGEYEEEVLKATNWEHVNFGNNKRLFMHKTLKGTFLLVSARGLKATDDIDLSDEEEAAKIDSRVLITVWKTKIERYLNGSGTKTTYGWRYGARLNFKVDWPAERPDVSYDQIDGDDVYTRQRQSHVFAVDLVNPCPDDFKSQE